MKRDILLWESDDSQCDVIGGSQSLIGDKTGGGVHMGGKVTYIGGGSCDTLGG